MTTKTNLMDKYFELVFKILEDKTVESYTKHHLKSFFAPDCQSKLANHLREELSRFAQSRNKLESKLDKIASELYDENNIHLLTNTQNELESFINELEDSPQFSEEAGGMIDNPHLYGYKNALAIFNEHFSKLTN